MPTTTDRPAVVLPAQLAAGDFNGQLLSPSARLIVGYLLAHADEAGNTRVSKNQIARDLSMSERLVRETIGEFVATQLISVVAIDRSLRTGTPGAHYNAINTYRLAEDYQPTASVTGEHDWPADLDDAACLRCGLDYGDWSADEEACRA